MTINAPSSAATATAVAATQTKPAFSPDFNMFLKLLTTQMQNQNPLDPMDTAQYTSQLVQYSQVEQSMQQTGLLKDVLARLSVNDMTQMTGLIGREVEMSSPATGLTAGGSSAWAWSLPHSAATIRGEVVDRSGRIVATATLDPASTSGRFTWDGKSADGNTAAPGAYTLRLTATDATGNSLPATVHGVGLVTEILAGPGGALLLGVGGVTIPATALVRVSA